MDDTQDCDECGQPSIDKGYYGCTRRPSDPAEMVCVLWFCDVCGMRHRSEPGADGGVARAAKWQRWIEEEGARHGVLWLTM